MSARTELAAILRPLLPPTWKLVTSERTIDDANAVVCRLTQQVIERHPVAPNSKLLVTFNLQVVAPGVDLDRVEDDLDEVTAVMLLVLESLPHGIYWGGSATKVLTADDGHLAYDIPLTITIALPTK